MNLLKVFAPKDFRNVNKLPSDLMELSFHPVENTGECFARAVFSDGSALARRIGRDGKIVQYGLIQLPALVTEDMQAEVVHYLLETFTKEEVEAMLDISLEDEPANVGSGEEVITNA